MIRCTAVSSRSASPGVRGSGCGETAILRLERETGTELRISQYCGERKIASSGLTGCGMEPETGIIREMIRFSQCLQHVLASTGWTQKEFAGRVGVSATNVSRWLGRKAVPDRIALGKVVDVLPPGLAPDLISAWVYDVLPPNAGRLVEIGPTNPNCRVQEPADEWPPGLNHAARRKFIDFSYLATNHPDVMDIVDVLHAAAMRANPSEAEPGSEKHDARKA